jgi:hypothetical protein
MLSGLNPHTVKPHTVLHILLFERSTTSEYCISVARDVTASFIRLKLSEHLVSLNLIFCARTVMI